MRSPRSPSPPAGTGRWNPASAATSAHTTAWQEAAAPWTARVAGGARTRERSARERPIAPAARVAAATACSRTASNATTATWTAMIAVRRAASRGVRRAFPNAEMPSDLTSGVCRRRGCVPTTSARAASSRRPRATLLRRAAPRSSASPSLCRSCRQRGWTDTRAAGRRGRAGVAAPGRARTPRATATAIRPKRPGRSRWWMHGARPPSDERTPQRAA